MIIPIHYPVAFSDGTIKPDTVRAGDEVHVVGLQDWRYLCRVTVTREFVGSDGFKKTSAPMVFDPPNEVGMIKFRGPVTIPELPEGRATYHIVVQPHCWVDGVWQRSYRTPDIAVTIVK